MILTSSIPTDWPTFWATLLSGILAAVATLLAVVYSNKKTRNQLLEEQKKQEKKNNFVVIQPSCQLKRFDQILDNLIISNDYNRIILLSGDDGFDFYDNINKQTTYLQRLLFIRNNSKNDIQNIYIDTKTVLLNLDSNEKKKYDTSNFVKLLRSQETIIVRLANEEQFLSICEMNKKMIGSELSFACEIKYETLADQIINYGYEMIIKNDKQIEVLKDGIESVIDIIGDASTSDKQSIFRNLQDSISSIDRSSYAWQKMGLAQMSGAYAVFQDIQRQQKDGLTSDVGGTKEFEN